MMDFKIINIIYIYNNIIYIIIIYYMSVNKVSAVRLREAKGRLSYKRGGRELKGKVRE